MSLSFWKFDLLTISPLQAQPSPSSHTPSGADRDSGLDCANCKLKTNINTNTKPNTALDSLMTWVVPPVSRKVLQQTSPQLCGRPGQHKYSQIKQQTIFLLMVGLRNNKFQQEKEIFSEFLFVDSGSYLAVVGHCNGSKESNERQRELHRDLVFFLQNIKINTRPVGGAFYMCSLISPLSLVTWPFARDIENIIPECILADLRCTYASVISQFFKVLPRLHFGSIPIEKLHWRSVPICPIFLGSNWCRAEYLDITFSFDKYKLFGQFSRHFRQFLEFFFISSSSSNGLEGWGTCYNNAIADLFQHIEGLLQGWTNKKITWCQDAEVA